MLDNYSNQASGLIGLGLQQGPRMIAVVSHGDEQAELPLLWQLCMTLINFGYAVSVLDGTTMESESNPGLAQLLDNAHWQNATNRDTPTWTVLAASQGLQQLCSQGFPQNRAWDELGHLFPFDSVVILYARVDWVIPLVAGYEIEPLIPVSEGRASLLTSYLALKRLLITGKLRPTIVNMVPDRPDARHFVEQSVSVSLSECARKFLDEDVRTLKITEQSLENSQNPDIQRLALRLVENAVTLGKKPVNMATETRMPLTNNNDQFAGSH